MKRWSDLKILIACEFSGRVRDAFIDEGFNATSCDLLPCESKGPHIQDDILKVITYGWDAIIAFPPCTYLTLAGNAWMSHPEDKHLPYDDRRPHPKFPNRRNQRKEAMKFFLTFFDIANIKHIAVENPIGVMNKSYRKPDQIIDPYQFGENAKKSTCLWLQNLPLLTPTNIVEVDYVKTSTGRKFSKWEWEISGNKKDRAKLRSTTFSGISEAMAQQWGNFLKDTYI